MLNENGEFCIFCVSQMRLCIMNNMHIACFQLLELLNVLLYSEIMVIRPD